MLLRHTILKFKWNCHTFSCSSPQNWTMFPYTNFAFYFHNKLNSNSFQYLRPFHICGVVSISLNAFTFLCTISIFSNAAKISHFTYSNGKHFIDHRQCQQIQFNLIVRKIFRSLNLLIYTFHTDCLCDKNNN